VGIGKFKMQPRLCFVVQNDGMGTQYALVKKLKGSVNFNDLAAYVKRVNALLV
jgi:hypothetical protein